MYNWLKSILIGKPACEHKWVEENEYEVSNRFTNHTIRYIHLLRCEKCGDMKNHIVKTG